MAALISDGLALCQHLERVAHRRVEELMDGVAFVAECSGFVPDDPGDDFLAGLEEEMGLVGEENGFQAEAFADAR
jgi:hypothetical protein